MDAYSYKAVDRTGKIQTGTAQAKSEQEVIEMLRQKDVIPISVQQGASSLGSINIGRKQKKIKVVDMTVFCRQMGTMLRAGLALDRAMSIQLEQTENPTLRTALNKLDVKIRSGVPMSKAMAEQPTVFSNILISMVEAGETTGQLDDALERMATHFEKEDKINRRVKGAMVYPMVLAILTFVVATGLIIFVIPTFESIFEEAGGTLPALTAAVVGLSRLLTRFWFIAIALAGVLVYAIKAWITSEKGRLQFDTFKLNNRFLKKPMTMIVTARFTRTLSTLLQSGIPLVSAVQAAGETTNNMVVASKVRGVIPRIQSGAPMSVALREVGLFPDMMVSLLSIGEETGAMDNMLARTADYYDEEFDAAISRLLAMIEPLMIVFMAAIIGTIVIAIYLPMFDMMLGENIGL